MSHLLEYEDRVAPELQGNELLNMVVKHRRQIHQVLGEDIDIIIADSRYGFIRQVTQGATERRGEVSNTASDRLDQIVLNRWLGIPIFLAVMYIMFLFTINVSAAFIDFFDIAAGTIFVDGFANLLDGIGTPGWLIALLADGAGGGIQTVATFIPVIGFMFLFLSILEDSGYMARAAFVMDRLMRFVGLPGKSFVPMLVGFGCNVPAIMATRTLENSADYEELLKRLGARSIPRIRFRDNHILLMIPLPEHANEIDVISDLIKALLRHQGKDWHSFHPLRLKYGKRPALEPDACFYIIDSNNFLTNFCTTIAINNGS